MINKTEISALIDYLKTNEENNPRIAKSFLEDVVSIFEENEQYRAIGTVEECQEAMGKQKVIKPVFEINYGDFESRFACACGKRIVVRHNRGVMDNNDAPNYCSNCGQKFDWTE